MPPLAPAAALRWATVKRIVERLHPNEILELGCGGGAFALRLAGLTAHLTAVEPDRTSYELASSRLDGRVARLIHGDHTKVSSGEEFDLVCAFEVLEHLEDDRAAIAAWSELVRPGGHLLISTPADPARMGPWDQAVGHFRRYSAEQMHRLLEGGGLTEVALVHYGWPIGYLLEGARNRIAARRLATLSPDLAERTSSSGRQMQPRGLLAGATVRAAVMPFAAIQRWVPERGIALVALARRPA